MPNTIFDITGEYAAFMDLVTNEEFTDEEAIQATLDSLQYDLEKKAEGYALVINQLSADVTTCDGEIKRFMHKKELRENAIKRLKNAILFAMNTLGKTELKAGNYTFKISKNGGKVPLNWAEGYKDDPTLLPERWRIKTEVWKPDTEAIRAALEEGEQIPGVELGQRGTRLSLK